MKKTPSPVMIDPKAYAEYKDFRERISALAMFAGTIAVDNLGASVYRAQEDAREHLDDGAVCNKIDALHYAIGKAVSYLHNKLKLARVGTRGWLDYGSEVYQSQSRVVTNVQMLARETFGESYLKLQGLSRQIIDAQCIPYPAIASEILLATSWVRITRNIVAYLWGRWGVSAIKVFGHSKALLKHEKSKLDALTKIDAQMTGIYRVCENTIKRIGVITYSREDCLWQEYHEEEDKLINSILETSGELTFNAKLSELNDLDWVEFYVANAIQETQAFGGIPSEVTEEIHNLNPDLLEPMTRMIFEVAKAVGPTDDVYDYADYLNENNYEAYTAFKTAVLNKTKEQFNLV